VTVTYSRIEGNGAATIDPGVLNVDDGRIFFDSSRIQYNVGSGIDDGGVNARVSLSADEIKAGYNTLYQHGIDEFYVHGEATAFIGMQRREDITTFIIRTPTAAG